jgi:hypothetical protein
VIGAVAGGCVVSVVSRNRKRRARGLFLLGFLCGSTATALLRSRRRVLKALAVLTRRAEVSGIQRLLAR